METLKDALEKDQKIKIEGDGRSIIAIVDSIEAGSFGIKATDNSPELIGLKIGAKVQGTFLKEQKVCLFESRVLKKEISPPKVLLSWPKSFVHEDLRCYQRADFTGVEGPISFRYALVKKGQSEEIEFRERGMATWVGGNGLVMVTLNEIPRGTVLAIELNRPISNAPIRVFGRVHKTKDHGSLFHVRVEFEALHENDRDIILKYCLQKQASLGKASAPDTTVSK